eukprot:12349894-Prorocentrum_lima.AAC.1
MTSSLVGSEMCIRDSLLGLTVTSASLSASTSMVGAAFGCRESGEGRFTVSYTHLTLPTICSV